MSKKMIAIDGPSGAGKSTTAKILARRLNYKYIDTGAMYRAVTLQALQKNIDFSAKKEIANLANKLDIDFSFPDAEGKVKVYLEGKEVSDELRTAEVDKNVSEIASIPKVREIMLIKQRELAKTDSVVMDGRDIGSRVLPEADLKIYLTANLTTRAERRKEELHNRGEKLDLEKVKCDLNERDKKDQNRDHSPLTKAEDAIEVTTDNKTPQEVVEEICRLLEEEEEDG